MAVPEPVDILVFDTGPLTHFARQNWLGVLKAVAGKRKALMPDVVLEELRLLALRDSRVSAATTADWIEHRELDSRPEIEAFALFSSYLVKGEHNRGETAVLALARTTGGIAVIDDGGGRKVGRANGVVVRPTLARCVRPSTRSCSPSKSSQPWPMTCWPASTVFPSSRAASRLGHATPALFP